MSAPRLVAVTLVWPGCAPHRSAIKARSDRDAARRALRFFSGAVVCVAGDSAATEIAAGVPPEAADELAEYARGAHKRAAAARCGGAA